MDTSGVLDGLGTACKTYGPGRLPKADRRDIGAGYAGASAALGVILLYLLLALGLDALGSPIGSDWRFLATMSVVALPLVVPTAFVAAVVTWRVLPADLPHFGAVGGLVATVGTYVGALGVLLVVATGLAVTSRSAAPVFEAIVFTGFVGFVAFTMTVWLTVPIGCLCGAIYERVGRESGPD